MQVEVVSMHAAVSGDRPITWRGLVPVHVHDGNPSETNERLFRFFNRIDNADVRRLEEMEYLLPSLSVGDLIAWGGTTYRCAGSGFELITGDAKLLLP